MITALFIAPFLTFDGTTSPSGTFAVAWKVPGHEYSQSDMDKEDAMVNFPMEKVQNMLVNLKTQEMVASLGKMNGFPHENHGNMEAVYNADESLVVIDHDGKWSPQQVICTSTTGGPQIDLLRRSYKPLSAYAKAHHGKFTKTDIARLVYPFDGFRWEGNDLHFKVMAAVPKDMRDWSVPMEEIVTFGRGDYGLIVKNIRVIESTVS